MATKKIRTRIIQKHDTEAHWNLAVNFIPEKGEIIIYDDVKDESGAPKIKIGDGSKNPANLPFAADVTLTNLKITAKAEDINAIKGIEVTADELNQIPSMQTEIESKLSRSGDSMTGDLNMQSHNIKLGTCTLKYDSDNECLNFSFE